MEVKINAIKLNMTQIFLDSGRVIPATLVRTEDAITEEMLDKDVVVVGTSKGKGFAGVMKKWNFKGGSRTRGQSNKPRSAGAIGSQTPGRVWKGKKMAGRMGGDRVTVKGLKIIRVSPENKEFAVSGPVPGARNGKLLIKVLSED